MSLLCIDVGNTHAHFGVVGPAGAPMMDAVPTPALDDPATGLAPHLARVRADHPSLEGVAFCSVVPDATDRLRRVLGEGWPVFQLTHACALGVPVTYPRPAEIGQDRLANAAGARTLAEGAAVVIDLGTAVTFDIITAQGGYEGGIIAPGLAVMRAYLHERTAQLPRLDESLAVTGAIGRTTAEAMRIGTVVGFQGMIQALLDAVLAELAQRGGPPPTVLATGGDAGRLLGRLRPAPRVVPDLTLRGLAATWRLKFPKRK